ncbi:uncharacterized protein LOC124434316 [Xenia sp. Carnegie-2017]|uniref:uncharacterized protein LOC124434316 n=1 Tax=Xenia sp. Carnegie-2017 TaxID=2897299 RepID=UPI001F049E2A|nr:uncharacterized protein LOC124434316 [Xenia sp. Carnegie-2017]
MVSTEKKIAMLSFDGGGSKGVMELKILDDIFRLATIVSTNPERVDYLVNEDIDENEVHFLEDESVRERLIKDMEAVKDPIHPTDVYDMIVGTSTGSLIAFGLVGGNKVGNDHHERKRMTIEECIQMYCAKTKMIFKKSWLHNFFSHVPGLSHIPIVPYSQENVKDTLYNQFGDCSLSDLGGEHPLKHIAGAVARKLGKNEDLVLFDTANKDYSDYKAYKVLLASSNAPVYFDTPVVIGNAKYVDGCVGGNCPLAPAIPRVRKLFGKDVKHVSIVSVLSIAPPSSPKWEIPSDGGLFSWLRYFVKVSTDGNAVFNDVVKQNRHKNFVSKVVAAW